MKMVMLFIWLYLFYYSVCLNFSPSLTTTEIKSNSFFRIFAASTQDFWFEIALLKYFIESNALAFLVGDRLVLLIIVHFLNCSFDEQNGLLISMNLHGLVCERAINEY